MSNVVLSYDPEGGASESDLMIIVLTIICKVFFLIKTEKNNANFVNSLINELFYFVFKKIIITNKLAYALCGYL
ncbi:TPA: hypothetical protein SMO99_003557 [Proteus mirabilis]|uniref:hypothetical protein n=1 Tax=Proteus mirabilis TaxID=584 RepID=UPI0018C59ED5|nr:hypothetical protein [Proteus mirabilis]ELB1208024.1 hypothetical protein [Proteus mirabilis]MBG2972188.1 hypothetical protein [Proteus mirabilis]MBG3109790.1 hypothetical protein [Proteus mirabilis]MCT0065702.1 hypothetical protein [Proteus mirabilis]MDC5899897.1 hypothetical protein [Proteus mirabilis]